MAVFYHITTAKNLNSILTLGLRKGSWVTAKKELPEWVDTFVVDRIETSTERKGYIIKVIVPLTYVKKGQGRVGTEDLLEFRLKKAVTPGNLKVYRYFPIGIRHFGPNIKRVELETSTGKTKLLKRLTKKRKDFVKT